MIEVVEWTGVGGAQFKGWTGVVGGISLEVDEATNGFVCTTSCGDDDSVVAG